MKIKETATFIAAASVVIQKPIYQTKKHLTFYIFDLLKSKFF